MLSGVSVRIEDEDGTVFTGDLDRLASARALIEQVVARFPVVRGNPFADGLPRWLLARRSRGTESGVRSRSGLNGTYVRQFWDDARGTRVRERHDIGDLSTPLWS